MANSKSKRTTTQKKGGSAKGRTGGTKTPAKTQSFQTDIILLLILGASILMMVSNFSLGGYVGGAISTFLFGVMGVFAYVFPVLFFLLSVFIIANMGNSLLKKKLFAIFLFCCVICGLIQRISEDYMKSMTLMDYFHRSADYHSGGGIIGGAVSISTISAFGEVGGYIILILVLVICLIVITQKSFFIFFERLFLKLEQMVKGRKRRYEETQPERELKREIRERERDRKRQEKQERQAARLEKLNRELAMEDEEEEPYHVPELLPRKQSMKKQPEKKQEKKPEKDPEQKTENRSVRKPVKEPVISIQRGAAPTEEEIAAELSDDLFRTEMETDPMEESSVFEDQEEELPVRRREPQKNPKSSKAEIESGIQNIVQEIQSKPAAPVRQYRFPPLKLLKKGNGKIKGDSDEYLMETAQKLEDTLRNFGVNVTVTNVSCGPTVTQYELQPEQGVKVSRILALSDDIKLNLATPDIRIEAPIPGKAAVGIEVPNKENSPVMLRDLLQSAEFQNASSRLSFAVGKDIAGKTVVTDIAKMPHLLIAGSTGSGKSVCINTLITSILYKASPDEVKMIMIDPKVVELSVYNGIPHLLIPVVTDPKKAAGALNWAVQEMTKRYNTFAEFNVRKLEEYNHKVENMKVPEGETPPEKMPQIILIVDELADLMMVAPGEVEDAIVRLTQLARAAGIHLVIATQRPSVNVITGLIKANMPSRIAFAVSSGVDSRVILDSNGAEKLLGKGDMLFYPQGYPKPARLQGAFISDEEVSSVVEFLSNKNPAAQYSTSIQEQVNSSMEASFSGGAGSDDRDVYFEEAGRFIIEKDKASIGMLQRMFKIGFNRAARIMDQLADAGIVGPEEGTKPRKVLMTESEFEAYLGEHG